MNYLLRTLSVVLGAAVLWIPYYVWGVGSSNRMFDVGKFGFGIVVFSVTAIFGFVGLYVLQRVLLVGSALSIANFRLLLIVSTQLTAVLMIAIDSNWNWKAILAGMLVVAGAVVGAYAIE